MRFLLCAISVLGSNAEDPPALAADAEASPQEHSGLDPQRQPFLGSSATVSAALAAQQSFTEFLVQFKKDYTEDESFSRFKAYEANFHLVQEHNEKALPYTLGLNEFSDMTTEEFAATHLGFNGNASVWGDLPDLGFQAASVALPASVDWRASGAVTAVKNQGACGGCWAFSSTGALEGATKIKTGKLVSLSEQQILDCDHQSQESGCNGGIMAAAFTYALTATITTEESYPYVAHDGHCREERWTHGLKRGCVKGYHRPLHSEAALMSAVALQPVSVAVGGASMRSFQLYRSGVFTGECSVDLDHALLLVGYGTEAGRNYWLVKNSWGASWGLHGYIKIVRTKGKDGKCGIHRQTSIPVLSSTCSVVPENMLHDLITV